MHECYLQLPNRMCRGLAAVSSADVRRWRTRALRCMGVHAEDSSSSPTPELSVPHASPATLHATVDAFTETAVFQHMKNMRTMHATCGTNSPLWRHSLPGKPHSHERITHSVVRNPLTKSVSASRYPVAA